LNSGSLSCNSGDDRAPRARVTGDRPSLATVASQPLRRHDGLDRVNVLVAGVDHDVGSGAVIRYENGRKSHYAVSSRVCSDQTLRRYRVRPTEKSQFHRCRRECDRSPICSPPSTFTGRISTASPFPDKNALSHATDPIACRSIALGTTSKRRTRLSSLLSSIPTMTDRYRLVWLRPGPSDLLALPSLSEQVPAVFRGAAAVARACAEPTVGN